MLNRIMWCLAFTSPLLGLTTPSYANSVCENRESIVVKLQEMYNESHVASGLESGSKMVEIWTGENGSWTILITRASGISCVVASGNNWMSLEDEDQVLGTAS